MKNKVLLTVVSILVIFGFLAVVYQLTSTPQIYSEINIINSDDHINWSKNKKNILVEYSDIQCPACKTIHDFLKQFEATNSPYLKITKNVTLVYRHYPLSQIHKNALQASYAVEAAGKQGKFFDMLNSLFATQIEWEKLDNPNDYFIKLANNLNLNANNFKSDISSKEIKNKVTKDIQSGNQAGINSTPTFFLNGKKLDDITSLEEFKNILTNL